MFERMVNSCLIINMKQISLFYAENVLKMRKMRKSANYADPHHRILSDALSRAPVLSTYFELCSCILSVPSVAVQGVAHIQGWPLFNIIAVVCATNLPSLFFSLVAIWPPTAQVWSPVKNFSC